MSGARVHLPRPGAAAVMTMCGQVAEYVLTTTDAANVTCMTCRTAGHLDPEPTQAEAEAALATARRDVRNFHAWQTLERQRINDLRRELSKREDDLLKAERRAYSRLERAERRAIRAGVNLLIEVQP